MSYSARVRDERFVFDDLREVFAKANEEKSGDRLAGLAAGSERERVAAKRALADLTLAEIVDTPLVDPGRDEVSRLILESIDRASFARIAAAAHRFARRSPRPRHSATPAMSAAGGSEARARAGPPAIRRSGHRAPAKRSPVCGRAVEQRQ